MSEFPETKELGEDLGLGAQDKISLKSNAKGELQADVRVGGILSDNTAIDKIIKLQEYAWSELKKKFPNLKIANET